MIRKFGKLVVFGLLAMLLVVVPVASSMADTSAASYHWARKRPQFTLKVGDNVSGDWNTYLRRALDDWNENDTVTLDKVSGQTSQRRCRPTKGQVEVCNWRYGTKDGWLGLTRLYFNRRGDHIDAVTVKLNDSYFDSDGQYNNDTARRHTLCHELGHSMGLAGHENNQSCLNNSQYAVFHYVTPIASDFRDLEQLYDHKDGQTTVSGASVTSEEFVTPSALPSAPSEGDETVTVEKLPDGRTVVTFITWAKKD